jgi:hypothetical protein
MEQIVLLANERFHGVLESTAERHTEEIRRQQEVFDLERERLRAIADAERAARETREAELELVTKIGRIASHHGLDPATSIIGVRSLDISRMDTSRKHSVVSEIYEKKFLPFQELLNAEDLGVIVRYLSDTTVGEAPIRPTHMGDIFLIRNYHRAPGGWCWGNIHVSDMQLLIRKHGMRSDVALAWRGDGTAQIVGDDDRREDANLAEYARCRNLENTERDSTYAREAAEYNLRKGRAESAPFPSTIFDNFVDTVNGFLRRLI